VHPSQYIHEPVVSVSQQRSDRTIIVNLTPTTDFPRPIHVVATLDEVGSEPAAKPGSIKPREQGLELELPLKGFRGGTVGFHLDIDRYPRAFMRRKNLESDIPADDEEQAKNHIQITRLQLDDPKDARPIARQSTRLFDPNDRLPEERFLLGERDRGKRLKVDLQIDGLDRAGRASGEFDRAVLALKDEGGSVHEQVEIFGDRHVTTQMQTLPNGQGMRLQTEVTDQSIELNAVPNFKGFLVAELDADDDERHEVPIVFDGSPPRIENLKLRSATVDKGKPITISWRCDDLSGLAVAEFAVLKNQFAKFPEEAEHAIPGTAENGAEQSYDIPTVEIPFQPEEKKKTLWIRSRFKDHVGNIYEPKNALEVTIRNVIQPAGGAEDPAAKAKKIKGTVRGTVKLKGGYKPDGMTVKLEETEFSATTKNGGQFEIPNVPEGKYKIQATGYYNGERKGDTTREFTKPEDYPADFGEIIVVVDSVSKDDSK
jgi:hypothetical protein